MSRPGYRVLFITALALALFLGLDRLAPNQSLAQAQPQPQISSQSKPQSLAQIQSQAQTPQPQPQTSSQSRPQTPSPEELSVNQSQDGVVNPSEGDSVPVTILDDTLVIPIEPVPNLPLKWVGSDPESVLLVAPRTGPWSVFGQDAELGANMAIKSLGDSFKLRTIDEESPELLFDLTASPPPAAIIGHLYESSLLSVYPYYNQAKVPVLLTFLGQVPSRDLEPNYFKFPPEASIEGLKLALEVPRTGNRRPEQIIILQGPGPVEEALAEAFRQSLLNPSAPPATKQNPKPTKPRALNAKNVFTIPISQASDLAVLNELKISARDLVLLALPVRLAMSAAPVLSETKLKRGTLFAPTWLAVREVGAVYLAVGIENLQVLVPVDTGTTRNPNKSLNDFTRRYTQLYRREPTWASVLAFDAARLACLAASAEEGPSSFLADQNLSRTGVAGRYDLTGSGWPTSLIKVDEGRLAFLP
ncbi:MAG: ABC transporter substrate-binding protein [Deltaproteobacteria bacterium]|jgi:ABC-type branched-subunit amino acid transport system substrate-binding protein|nr:ABC transporter substrate-binding protein [Deltaproteobacteria bacterium]